MKLHQNFIGHSALDVNNNMNKACDLKSYLCVLSLKYNYTLRKKYKAVTEEVP